MSPTASWRHRTLDFSDQNYAETVYRTVTGLDGKVKDLYLDAMRECHLSSKDINDL